MGIRSRLKGIKQFIKDPQGFSNRHLDTMSAEYAKVQQGKLESERRPARPVAEEPQSQDEE